MRTRSPLSRARSTLAGIARGSQRAASVVISVGFAESEKRFDLSIDAMRLLAMPRCGCDVRLLRRWSVQSLAAGTSARSGREGAVAGHSEPARYAHCDRGRHRARASHRPVEIFGNVLAEAMALRTPIIAMRAGGNSEMLGADGSAAILVDDDRPESFADGLRSCCTNGERGRALAAAARGAPDRGVSSRPHDRCVRRNDADARRKRGDRRMNTHLLLTSNFPPLHDGIASWMSQLARHYGDDAMLVSLGSEPGQGASDARQSVRIDRMPIPRARLRNAQA